MKAKDALIAWTPPQWDRPTRGQIAVGPLLSKEDRDWTTPFAMTGGAAWVDRRKMTGLEAKAAVLVDFHTLVIVHGLDPHVVHRAFLAIDEYRDSIDPDSVPDDH